MVGELRRRHDRPLGARGSDLGHPPRALDATGHAAAAIHGARRRVVDCWTSLVWKRCVVGQWWNGSACAGTPAALIWKDALAQARTIVDRTGLPWRLPNAKEIESIVVPANTPPIDFDAFPGATPTWVWSSTPSFLGNRRVWSPMVVEFSLGSLGNDNDGLSTFQSRLVRDAK
jgi:hypothetical protein